MTEKENYQYRIGTNLAKYRGRRQRKRKIYQKGEPHTTTKLVYPHYNQKLQYQRLYMLEHFQFTPKSKMTQLDFKV